MTSPRAARLFAATDRVRSRMANRDVLLHGMRPYELKIEPAVVSAARATSVVAVPLHKSQHQGVVQGRACSVFTLPELIVILAIIGILAVFVAPRFTAINATRERSEYDKVVSAIAYARKAAVAQRRYACVAVTGTVVTLTIDPNPPESTSTPFGGTCPFTTALNLPSRDAACAAANQTCLQYATVSASPGTFQFDPLGRASSTVTINMSGFPSIKVEGETGYVH
jgi:Tfp pilus assembly protein FimT